MARHDEKLTLERVVRWVAANPRDVKPVFPEEGGLRERYRNPVADMSRVSAASVAAFDPAAIGKALLKAEITIPGVVRWLNDMRNDPKVSAAVRMQCLERMIEMQVAIAATHKPLREHLEAEVDGGKSAGPRVPADSAPIWAALDKKAQVG